MEVKFFLFFYSVITFLHGVILTLVLFYLAESEHKQSYTVIFGWGSDILPHSA